MWPHRHAFRWWYGEGGCDGRSRRRYFPPACSSAQDSGRRFEAQDCGPPFPGPVFGRGVDRHRRLGPNNCLKAPGGSAGAACDRNGKDGAGSSPTLPAAQIAQTLPESRVAQVVFVEKQNCGQCTKIRQEDSWRSLDDALGTSGGRQRPLQSPSLRTNRAIARKVYRGILPRRDIINIPGHDLPVGRRWRMGKMRPLTVVLLVTLVVACGGNDGTSVSSGNDGTSETSSLRADGASKVG